ncbi:MAG: ATP-binding protein [Anaerolineae bacterium]|nr:ATP-binding protein [Anaerolineae bacterium]
MPTLHIIVANSAGRMGESSMAENPFQYNMPIGDSGEFAGRQDVFAFVQANLVGEHQENALVLLGGHQMGKSSVLRQLPRALDARYIPIRLSLRASTVGNEKAWLTALAHALPDALALLNIQSARLPELPGHPADLREMLEGEVFAEGLRAMRRDRHLLVMVDNAERLLGAVQSHALPRDTFAFLAGLLEKHAHFDLLMTFDSRYESDLLAVGAPFDPALFYRLGPLSQAEMLALLTAAMPPEVAIEQGALAAIYDLTAGHPHLIQLVGWLLWERSAAHGHAGPLTVADVRAVDDNALAMGSEVLGAIWSHGSPQEQLVLTALTALSPEEPPRPVPFDDVGAWLIAADRPLDPRTVNATWRRLEYEGVLDLSADGRLTINGGLQRRWLREHVILPSEGAGTPWRRILLLGAAAVLLLALLVAIISALPQADSPVTTSGGEATITLNLDLQATAESYDATQTATAP